MVMLMATPNKTQYKDYISWYISEIPPPLLVTQFNIIIFFHVLDEAIPKELSNFLVVACSSDDSYSSENKQENM